jgi:hypothetical protein
MSELTWLRRLVEDQARTEVEQAVASGQETRFYLSNPPVTGNVVVAVDGVTKTADADYFVEDARLVRFALAPNAGSNITIQYDRQTFTDEELTEYLTAAALRFTGVAQIYTAAIYAIDSLLVGAATALDFGAGAETYNMSSVFARLQSLREMYMERVTEAIEGEGLITVQDMDFDATGTIHWTDNAYWFDW